MSTTGYAYAEMLALVRSLLLVSIRLSKAIAVMGELLKMRSLFCGEMSDRFLHPLFLNNHFLGMWEGDGETSTVCDIAVVRGEGRRRSPS